MPDEDPDPFDSYTVVINDEEQYSIWPSHRPLPPGWFDAGKAGSKAECLAHIDEVWTDIRPKSVRERLGNAQPENT